MYIALFKDYKEKGMWADSIRKKEESQDKPIQITSSNLLSQYDAGEAEADSRFKDRLLLVEGLVSEVRKNLAGSFVLVLRTGSYDKGIFCNFEREDESIATQVVPGLTAAVIGRCEGMITSGHISLNNCKLIFPKT